MAGDLPEDMVYTITTGFYPELFSGKPMWKAEMGTGRKGMQWVKQRGFSKDSVKRIAGKRIDKGGYGDFLWALKGGMPWKEAYDTLVKTKGEDYAAGIQERGKEVGYVSPSRAQFEEVLKGAGVPDWAIGLVADFSEDIRDNQHNVAFDHLEKLLGRKPADVKSVLKGIYNL